MIPALIVFDIDGTLFRTELVTVPAVQRTFVAHSLPEPEAKKICSFFGRPNEEYLDWLASLCSPQEAARIVDDTNRLELELVASEGRLYDGARDVLDALRASGYRLAVCSNGPEDYVDAFLDAHGVRGYFAAIRARGTKYPGKVEMLKEIVDAVNVSPVVVVGDRDDDVSAARANGALVIAACYGFGLIEEHEKADSRVGDIREVPSAIERLLRNTSACRV